MFSHPAAEPAQAETRQKFSPVTAVNYFTSQSLSDGQLFSTAFSVSVGFNWKQYWIDDDDDVKI